LIQALKAFGHSVSDIACTSKALGFPPLDDQSRGDRNLSEPHFKSEHCEIFRLAGLVWPPKTTSYQAFGFLGLRCLEVIYFLGQAWPREHDIEFANINPTLARITCWNSASEFSDLQNPWKPSIRTVTAQAKLAARYLGADGNEIVRPLEAWEVLSLIGWEKHWWSDGAQRPSFDLAVSLAGNAFSFWAIGPVMLASFGTIGMYLSSSVKAAKDASDSDDSDSD
jgi:hypothetical protein